MAQRTCTLDGCESPHRARGLCRKHYKFEYEMHDATCSMCGVEFKGHRATAKYCSDDCRAIDYLERTDIGQGNRGKRTTCPLPREHPVMQQYRLPEVWAPRSELPTNHPAMRRQRTWVAGSCVWCSTTFVILHQTTSRYCSQRCMRQSQSARRGRFVIQPARRLALYERDKWTCQLCMDPVEPSLPTSDIWAATLDHIECQAWTDEPNHDDDNLRLAHRWCNSVRGDETHHTAALLAV